MLRNLAWAALAAALAGAASGEGAGYKVIVHASNPVAEMKREQVALLFLNRNARWSNRSAQPVDQSTRSLVREAFSLDVLGQPVQAVQSQWQRRILKERVVPPPVKGSDAEIIAFVAKNEGGIGYVSEAAVLPSDVKAVRILK